MGTSFANTVEAAALEASLRVSHTNCTYICSFLRLAYFHAAGVLIGCFPLSRCQAWYLVDGRSADGESARRRRSVTCSWPMKKMASWRALRKFTHKPAALQYVYIGRTCSEYEVRDTEHPQHLSTPVCLVGCGLLTHDPAEPSWSRVLCTQRSIPDPPSDTYCAVQSSSSVARCGHWTWPLGLATTSTLSSLLVHRCDVQYYKLRLKPPEQVLESLNHQRTSYCTVGNRFSSGTKVVALAKKSGASALQSLYLWFAQSMPFTWLNTDYPVQNTHYRVPRPSIMQGDDVQVPGQLRPAGLNSSPTSLSWWEKNQQANDTSR